MSNKWVNESAVAPIRLKERNKKAGGRPSALKRALNCLNFCPKRGGGEEGQADDVNLPTSKTGFPVIRANPRINREKTGDFRKRWVPGDAFCFFFPFATPQMVERFPESKK